MEVVVVAINVPEKVKSKFQRERKTKIDFQKHKGQKYLMFKKSYQIRK